MIRIILKILSVMFLVSMSVREISAQNSSVGKSGFEINSKIYSSVGYEHNPYKSPNSYFDYVHNVSYSKTDLIETDMFGEYGYSLLLGKTFKKIYSFELTSEWQNKKYFNETILNTDRFNIGLTPSFVLNRWLSIGAGYEFEKRAMVDADILGEQTKYVLSYIQNSPQVFIKTRPFRKNYTNFYYTFNQQKYSSAYSAYRETDTILNKLDLDNTQHSFDLRILQYLGTRSSLSIRIIFYDRQYKFLPSYDSLLTPNYNYMRHYHDVNARISFKSKINNYLEINPYIKYERRNDMFNNYFSYNRFEGGLQTYFSIHKFLLDLDMWYRSFNYDKFEAPTVSRPYPVLQYKYLNASATLTYKIAKGFDISLISSYEKRNSNADRITWKYRRGYENYYFDLGIIIYPDKWLNLN